MILLVACGSPASPAHSPSNVATHAEPTRRELALRQLVDHAGAKHALWLEPGHESGVDTNDPCCGFSYDGDRYNDALATCAVAAKQCPAGTSPVYPGLADDHVCGALRRCVPDPQLRVIVHDTTPVHGVDAVERAVAIGDA